MTNELMGIIGVALFTGFLFWLQHAIWILGRRRRRTHGAYIMLSGENDRPRSRRGVAVGERNQRLGKLKFQRGLLNRGEDWFTSAYGASAVALYLNQPQTRRRSSR